MLLERPPRPALRPFVRTVWAQRAPSWPREAEAWRERVLPTGETHLVFRLSSQPLRVFAAPLDLCGRTFGHALVGGARAAFYLKEVAEPAFSVGAQLRPGAARALFGVPADEIGGRHVALETLWGPVADEVRERLAETVELERQLDLLEAVLAARLPAVRGIHPAVAAALAHFSVAADVRAAVRDSGYSHRRFLALFKQDVGLGPKLYTRVLRFQRALRRLKAEPGSAWADLAFDCGYSDQAHFNREFRELTGLTPGLYRQASPRLSHHVPLQAPRA